MNPLRLLFCAGLLVASGLLLAAPALVQACGVAAGLNVKVAIADESAIIIWDEASKTEHFIRRASFATEAQDFGFLVPTPSQPELGEASDEAFKFLEVYRPPSKGKAPPPVQVLEEKRVAGQDMVVLKATDADALAKWLTNHGYEFVPTLKDWVKPYIDAKWIITASKVAKDKNGLAAKNVAMAAVRMSFKTDKPFFPYSEPASPRDNTATAPARLLRLFFINKFTAPDVRIEGTMGTKGENWPGKWVRAYTLSDYKAIIKEDGKREIQRTAITSLENLLKLPGNSPPWPWYCTVFEDHSSPRPGTDDVFFRITAPSK